jgi:leucyl-tRNA synthetase
MILGENGEKMSKSRGNVVNPDDVIDEFGADAFRTYELFMGAFDQPIPWSTNGVSGCRRFLNRVWRLQDMINDEEGYSKDLEMTVHRMIKKVSHDYNTLKFNTAIAAMMSFVNDVYVKGSITKDELTTLVTLLCPVSPHMCEGIWQNLGMEGFCSIAKWSQYDESKCIAATQELAVQVNGKVRGRITVPQNASEDEIKEVALNDPSVKRNTDGKTIRKVIVIKGRIVNIVV